jgi:DNA helicase-2/ATP-dependent DNA helicase PcrA
MVTACPGSGKTRIVTTRIANLITNHDVPPDRILAVTFTKKAAVEMQERVERIVSADGLNIGTFHSACFKILRNEIAWFDERMQGFSIIEGGRQLRVVKDVIKAALRSENAANPGEILRAISLAKNELQTPDDIDTDEDRVTAMVWRGYEVEKRKLRLYDFDDLLFEVWRMLSENEFIRAAYSGVLSYYLVDEFQDTNKAQFEVLRLLTQDNPNLMVVADDDQAVYSWRGAVPAYTIGFTDYYPDAVVVRMETNYRSDSKIIEHANKLIGHNFNRLPKNPVANSAEAGSVTVWTAMDEREEAAQVCKEITELREQQGITDIAVLYRTNAQSRALEDECVRRGIPYTVVGSLGFYNRREVKDIVAYLRVVEFDDDTAFERIVNVPSRYLGKAFLSELRGFAESAKCSLLKAIGVGAYQFSKPYMTPRSKELASLIWQLKQRRQESTPSEMVQATRDLFRYDAYVTRDDVESDPDNSRIQNLDELVEAAKGYSTLREFLNYAEQMGARACRDDDVKDKVQLLTLHRAKGLEWHSVFIAGVSKGILPHKRAESTEEERRLFFVGLTRAKKQLFVSSLRKYQGKDVEPSPFLAEAGFVLTLEEKRCAF